MPTADFEFASDACISFRKMWMQTMSRIHNGWLPLKKFVGKVKVKSYYVHVVLSAADTTNM